MSTYIRSPRTLTMHCPVDGCKWVKTVFEDPRKISLERRAILCRNQHIARHRKATTLINGR